MLSLCQDFVFLTYSKSTVIIPMVPGIRFDFKRMYSHIKKYVEIREGHLHGLMALYFNGLMTYFLCQCSNAYIPSQPSKMEILAFICFQRVPI